MRSVRRRPGELVDIVFVYCIAKNRICAELLPAILIGIGTIVLCAGDLRFQQLGLLLLRRVRDSRLLIPSTRFFAPCLSDLPTPRLGSAALNACPSAMISSATERLRGWWDAAADRVRSCCARSSSCSRSRARLRRRWLSSSCSRSASLDRVCSGLSHALSLGRVVDWVRSWLNTPPSPPSSSSG